MASEHYVVELLESAQQELEEIAHLHLSLSGPNSASSITDLILSALENLETFPLSGPAMREAELRSMGYRFVVAGKYIAIYRLIGETVFVYHIFDGRSDYPTLFRSELFRPRE